jgi:hypothetical protein
MGKGYPFIHPYVKLQPSTYTLQYNHMLNTDFLIMTLKAKVLKRKKQ